MVVGGGRERERLKYAWCLEWCHCGGHLSWHTTACCPLRSLPWKCEWEKRLSKQSMPRLNRCVGQHRPIQPRVCSSSRHRRWDLFLAPVILSGPYDLLWSKERNRRRVQRAHSWATCDFTLWAASHHGKTTWKMRNAQPPRAISASSAEIWFEHLVEPILGSPGTGLPPCQRAKQCHRDQLHSTELCSNHSVNK